MPCILTNFSPKVAGLLTHEQVASDEKDTNKVAYIPTNNGSYFAHWVQQERFPPFVKVHIVDKNVFYRFINSDRSTQITR